MEQLQRSYVQKRAYVRRIINYYEKLEVQYGLHHLNADRTRHITN